MGSEDKATMTGAWQTVCTTSDLLADGGICVNFQDNQVAIFFAAANNSLYAIDNYDPIGAAYVLSRGIFGSLGEAVVVASPLYKQHFDLRTGQCLEQPELKVAVYDVQIVDESVQLRLPVSS
ncbi:MAG: nitrite reductase small subunit NirD [Pseudomonadales bacterium]